MEIISAAQAIQKYVKDDMTVAVEGFIGLMKVEELLIALRESFLKTGHPKNLTIVHCAGQGDGTSPGCGMNRLAVEGLIGTVIAGHFAMAPDIQKLILDNKIAGYNLPQGVIAHLFRDIAAGKPGTITPVGLDTFVDPLLDGGRLNQKARDAGQIVERIEILGRPQLLYKAFPIDVAFLRATSADDNGNCSMEKEPVFLEVTAMAQAAKNSGGKVIVQVERKTSAINPQSVKIPGIYVDALVEAKAENHHMSNTTEYNPAYSGEMRAVTSESAVKGIKTNEFDVRHFIAQRAAEELFPGAVVNLGIGMPEGISAAAAQAGLPDLILTTESGTVGGYPASGGDFGAALNPDCILSQPEQFDFYDGGGLDIAFLGLAQADQWGNVNVSKFGPKIAGCGGFINITQNAKTVVFCGTFTSGGLKTDFSNGRLQIVQEGRIKKFVRQVEQITFSGKRAMEKNQRVLFITERAVFQLFPDGLKLIELTPGVDWEKDVLSQMEFSGLHRA